MGRRLVPALALVEQDHVLVVDRQTAVRVNGDAEQAGVSLPHASHQPRHFRVSHRAYTIRADISRTVLSCRLKMCYCHCTRCPEILICLIRNFYNF